MIDVPAILTFPLWPGQGPIRFGAVVGFLVVFAVVEIVVVVIVSGIVVVVVVEVVVVVLVVVGTVVIVVVFFGLRFFFVVLPSSIESHQIAKGWQGNILITIDDFSEVYAFFLTLSIYIGTFSGLFHN